MESFFIDLFEWAHGTQPNVAFRGSVYGNAGLCLVALTLITVLGYYYGATSASARYAHRKYWLGAALLNALSNAITVLIVEHSSPDIALLSTPSLSLAGIAALYCLVAYVILSFIVKWWSPNARRTPV